LTAPTWVVADELTQQIQESLVELGYDPGNTDGEASVATAVAIATYQAERELEVTGEVSPVIAGIMAAEIRKENAANEGAPSGETTAAAEPASTPEPEAEQEPEPEPVVTPEELRAAQQACLSEKIAEAQKKTKRNQGFSDILSAVTKTASMTGDAEVAQTAGTVYTANSTAADLSSAAKNLGLTEDEIEACENPPEEYFD
jgi:peptidoglycan hydrolase-like protein with peptidoglycan-binding domain